MGNFNTSVFYSEYSSIYSQVYIVSWDAPLQNESKKLNNILPGAHKFEKSNSFRKK